MLHFSFLKYISTVLFVRKHLSLLLSRLGSCFFFWSAHSEHLVC